jgi:bla regulator protein BlaR1
MKLKVLAVAAAVAGLAALACAEEIKINTTEVNGRLVDDINLPFADDPAVLGTWLSVDFVAEPEDFTPGIKQFQDDLYLGGFTFLPKGAMGVIPFAPKSAPWFRWTKGVVTHNGDKTASRYILKDIKGVKYMFFEWKSGDYTIRHQKPQYYVLKKR